MLRAIGLDATRLLLWLGLAVLLATFRSPYVAALPLAEGEAFALQTVRRLARLEEGGALLAAPDDAGSRAALLAAMRAGAEASPGSPALELLPASGDSAVVLASPDWLFMLAVTPTLPEAGLAEPQANGEREVWAWPRRAEADLATVFCVRDGATYSTRNLTRRYMTTAHPPQPGQSRPRRRQPNAGPDDEYWGIDRQFWRVVPN